MRPCEEKGLRWKDIDLFEKLLVVRRQGTKSDAGARVIPLNRDAIVALSELGNRARNSGPLTLITMSSRRLSL